MGLGEGPYLTSWARRAGSSSKRPAQAPLPLPQPLSLRNTAAASSAQPHPSAPCRLQYRECGTRWVARVARLQEELLAQSLWGGAFKVGKGFCALHLP